MNVLHGRKNMKETGTTGIITKGLVIAGEFDSYLSLSPSFLIPLG